MEGGVGGATRLRGFAGMKTEIAPPSPLPPSCFCLPSAIKRRRRTWHTGEGTNTATQSDLKRRCESKGIAKAGDERGTSRRGRRRRASRGGFVRPLEETSGAPSEDRWARGSDRGGLETEMFGEVDKEKCT
mmetsp:Transcript_57002/g.121028  ORF Transcript_57002/g.121028 Transcript_57002/m.121028 type:complete len:131 (+) Transcript_57002:241-633(+)